MQSFATLTSRIIPLPRRDIDTDQIIPARYLKVTDKSGLAEGLFYSWRYRQDGSPEPEFPLNQAKYQNAKILLAGDNFGCGSSREHAPWALMGWGIRAIFSTSFADIFRNNALKNGLLPVIVENSIHKKLLDAATDPSGAEVTIDLAAQMVRLPDGTQAAFPIDGFNKTCLLEGLDSIGYLLRHEEEIAAYEGKAAVYESR
jgi:3-isopropylmalate/(R)-2-methylmalate dehydratase small subunit